MAPKKKILKPKKIIKQKQKQKQNTNINIHIDQSKRTNPRQPSAPKPPPQIAISIPPINYHPLQFQQHALPHPPQPQPQAQPISQPIAQPQAQPLGEQAITRNEYNNFINGFQNRMNNIDTKLDNYFNTDTNSNQSFESVLNNSSTNLEKENPDLFETPKPKPKKPNIIIVDDRPKPQPETPTDTPYSYVRKPNTIRTLTHNETFKTPKIVDEPIFKANLLLEPPKEEPNLIQEAIQAQPIEEPLNEQVLKDIGKIVDDNNIPKPNDIINRILSRKNVYEENVNPYTGKIYSSYSNMKRSLITFYEQ